MFPPRRPRRTGRLLLPQPGAASDRQPRRLPHLQEGHPMTGPGRTGVDPRPVSDRLWPKVDQGAGPDACWPFMGSRNEHGYGSIRGENGRTTKAHRVAWMLANPGVEITNSDHICHHCDNPPCCNPAHLYCGTYQTNTADKVSRGRQLRGERMSELLRGSVPSGPDHWTHRTPITHCKAGHDLVITAVRSGTGRRCGVCAADYQRRYRSRKRDS